MISDPAMIRHRNRIMSHDLAITVVIVNQSPKLVQVKDRQGITESFFGVSNQAILV